jgi:hypothetical protein
MCYSQPVGETTKLSKPTPGPWQWRVNLCCPGELKGAFVEAAGGTIAVAQVHARDGIDSQQVCEANAALIADAPETAAERDRLREQRDELLQVLTGGVDEPQLRRLEAVGALVAEIENRIDWRTGEDPDAVRQTIDECRDLIRAARAAVTKAK